MDPSSLIDAAISHHQAGRLAQAKTLYLQILQSSPQDANALHLLGLVFHQLGEQQAAIDYIKRAIAINPSAATFHTNLGAVYQAAGDLRNAVTSCQRAVQLNPDDSKAHFNLGCAYQALGKLDEAVGNYRNAIRIKPDYAEAQYNLGKTLKNQGKLSEAVTCYQRALELKPDYAEAHSNLLLTQHYCDDVSLTKLAQAHTEYERQHATPLRTNWTPHDNARDGRRALRLGFLSPNLGQHPVGFFLIGLLENFHRPAAEIICYSDRTTRDELTVRIQAAATTWRDVVDWSDERLAQQICEDRIDILFDLAGHTANNRLLVFARKPAPIQITWIGYVGTTGLAAMDYILADRHEIPAESASHYRERVLWMPDGYVCYAPPSYAPQVSALPAKELGRMTFGCFNNPAKLNAQVVEAWAEILKRVPSSRLVLKYKRMIDSSAAGRFAEMFASHGVDPARVAFLDKLPHAELLGKYRLIDIALDPFPYSGGLTTCEALWMGVPVITCPGETFASRHSLSHLSNVGLTETVTRDLSDYVALAVGLADDLPRLAKWRAELREQMASSPLCDGRRFAGNLMKILCTIWQEWCETSDSGFSCLGGGPHARPREA